MKKAQLNNYRSRAAFKLLEIEEKFKVIGNLTNLLDLGSAPGSWCQAAKSISPSIKIAAADLLQVLSM